MHSRALRSVLLVVVIVLAVGLLGSCGGGGQSEGGSQEGGSGGNGGSGQQNNGNGGGGSDQESENAQRAREVRIALGTIDSVAAEDDTFTLLPSTEEQGEEPIAFVVRPTTGIIVGDQEADLTALQEGQQAKVRYLTVEGENRARAVQVVGE